jgi:hypothetical protein
VEDKVLSDNPYEKQGFDFDPELIDLFDAVLQNITDEGELKEEFLKLKFIKKLDGTYNGKAGPLKQLIEKMAVIEREFTTSQLDMQRAISDLTMVAKTIRKAVDAKTQKELQESINTLEGLEHREQFYTWNQKNGS